MIARIFILVAALLGCGAWGQSPVQVMVNPTNNAVVVPDAFWPSNRLVVLATLSLDSSINAGVPNGSGATVHWSQLLGVPAGFADGTDDGGDGGTNFIDSVSADFEVLAASLSLTNTTGTGQILRASALSGYLTSAAAASLYQPLDPDLTTLATLNGGSLTNLNGSAITSGTVAEARIDSAIARLDSPTFTGTVNFEGLQADAIQVPFASRYAATDASSNLVATSDGGSWTNLNASALSSGTVPDARIDSAIARLASPALTGSPTAPTAALGTSNTVVSTTEFAHQVAALRQLASDVLTQLSALTNGTAGQLVTATGAGTFALSNAVAGGSGADVQVFTTPGANTWTKPTGKTVTYVYAISGGGGGGSGRRAAAGTVRTAGAGGGGGSATWHEFSTADLGATETVTVGSGGSGGAAVTVDNTNGSTGGTGGNSTFGTWLYVSGSIGGGAGTASAAAAGYGNASMSTGGNGATSSATGGSGNSAPSPYGGKAGAGGGSGGGVSSADAESIGGYGGNGPVMWRGTAQIAAGAGGAARSNGSNGGTAGATVRVGGAGGGGGGSGITAAAGSGGDGGLYGGGGGGGGASLNGYNSGAGGNGADGIVVVISY